MGGLVGLWRGARRWVEGAGVGVCRGRVHGSDCAEGGGEMGIAAVEVDRCRLAYQRLFIKRGVLSVCLSSNGNCRVLSRYLQRELAKHTARLVRGRLLV